ncbi:hypothetical protein BDN72DRAFT_905022 [Pluteus cervinus]|uniref:Uncharacterized protein n=1 Tax=Pluteus cervinus TaxID=181527 RepID=A0ACD3A6B8_9AGAR|nr:hypothetical protein BDN72DRAFT_905022 [Pluteus cervinus]
MSIPSQNNTGINSSAQYMHNNGPQESNHAPRNNGSVVSGGTHNGPSNNTSSSQTANATGVTTGPVYAPLVINAAFNFFGGSHATFAGFPTSGPMPAQPTPAQPTPQQPTSTQQPTSAPPAVQVTPTQAGPTHAPDSNNHAAPNTDNANQNANQNA